MYYDIIVKRTERAIIMGVYLNPNNQNFYEAVNKEIYVDKSLLIERIEYLKEKVNKYICVSRPRRFGKSTDANMLVAYYSKGCDSLHIFNDLKISQTELYQKHLNQHNVIHVNMQDFLGYTHDVGKMIILLTRRIINDLKKSYNVELFDESILSMSLEDVYSATNEQFIFIIDEWDCIFREYSENKEAQNRYLDFLRNLLKDKPYVELAYMTGILPIKKYGTHSALNMFEEISMIEPELLAEFMGFTENEVKDLCSLYNVSYEEMREWYDGYQFGKKAVYCPWDVISYCRNLCADPDAIPEDFWSNTSSNSIVSRFIDKANKQTRDEIENLISGETVIKEIKQELTYNELDKSIENLWSILFTTGYLTQRERIDSRKLRLAIPNREIKELFELQIREWFQEKSSEDVKKLDKLCMAFPDGDAETIEDLFNDYLWNTISIRDTAVKGRKENFYHGVLLGLLSHMENWAVWSNIESGEGYCYILLEVPENRVGVVIEMKYAQEDRMEAACTEALKQIEQRQYAVRLKSDGMKNIVNYGIACYRKHCKVKIGKENS